MYLQNVKNKFKKKQDNIPYFKNLVRKYIYCVKYVNMIKANMHKNSILYKNNKTWKTLH